jgi:hypothetical protein
MEHAILARITIYEGGEGLSEIATARIYKAEALGYTIETN